MRVRRRRGGLSTPVREQAAPGANHQHCLVRTGGQALRAAVDAEHAPARQARLDAAATSGAGGGGGSSGGGSAAATAELSRQLEALRQQLSFREQEVGRQGGYRVRVRSIAPVCLAERASRRWAVRAAPQWTPLSVWLSMARLLLRAAWRAQRRLPPRPVRSASPGKPLCGGAASGDQRARSGRTSRAGQALSISYSSLCRGPGQRCRSAQQR
jgi:hypothetical protein